MAVNAFAAAICRLSSHCESRLGPWNATAQTTPARFTATAQWWLYRQPVAKARFANGLGLDL